MKQFRIPLLCKLLRGEHGQTGVVLAIVLLASVTLGGAAIEAGHVYYAYDLLVASTNAAAMAGAQAMPNITTASSAVTTYSSESGQKNASPLLQSANITSNFYCSSTVGTTLDVACQAPSSGSCTTNSTCNALSVTQTAKVPLWFGGLVGVRTMTLSVTRTTAMRGGSTGPWNIAIILDATSSMTDNDSGTSCSGTRETCALQGIQALLQDMYPCSLGVTCSSSTAIVDNVALYVFPPLLQSTAPQDYCSGGHSPTHEYYEVPNLPNTGTASTSWTDTIIPFYSSSTTPTYPDFRTSDSATSLNTSSNIVKASGYSGSGCAGVVATGGAHTYYAQVIYQAQSDLVALQSKNPQSQNAIILLGDGDQNATVTCNLASGTGTCTTTYTTIASTSNLQASSTNSLNGVAFNNPTSTTYPSAVGECGQGVIAAQAATKANTTVFTIGYGAPISGGCTTDQTYTATGNTSYGGGAWPNTASGNDNGKQPCDELAAMASNSVNFYSDDGSSCVATSPTNANIKSMTAIFRAIADNMSGPRIIPNGTN
jgi:Flp pilus assembly protein TadG